VTDVIDPPPVRRPPPHWGTQEKLLARIEQKRAAVLAWLSAETFTTARLLEEVLGLSKTPTHKTLAAMKRDGLIDHQVIEWHAASLQIVVLTAHGAALAGAGGNGYEVGKVATSSIGHQLDVQKARLCLERAGWSDWVAEPALRAEAAEEVIARVPHMKRRWPKVPDAVGRSKAGRLVAVEMERSIKTTKNYRPILGKYMHMMDSTKVVGGVLYVTTSDRVRDALHAKLRGIETVSVPVGVKPHPGVKQTDPLVYEQQYFAGQKFFFASMDDLKTNTSPRHAAETADEYRQRIERQKQQQQPPEGDA
jgi:hypothetical protein